MKVLILILVINALLPCHHGAVTRINVPMKVENMDNFMEMVHNKTGDHIHTGFEKIEEYFSLPYVLGLRKGTGGDNYIGQFASTLMHMLEVLPEIVSPELFKFTEVFRYFSEEDEKKLDKILKEKIKNGTPVYTNRVWEEAGIGTKQWEENPILHRLMSYCSYSYQVEDFSAKYMFCQYLLDYGAISVPIAFEELKAEKFSGKHMFCSMVIDYGAVSVPIAFEKLKALLGDGARKYCQPKNSIHKVQC